MELALAITSAANNRFLLIASRCTIRKTQINFTDGFGEVF